MSRHQPPPKGYPRTTALASAELPSHALDALYRQRCWCHWLHAAPHGRVWPIRQSINNGGTAASRRQQHRCMDLYMAQQGTVLQQGASGIHSHHAVVCFAGPVILPMTSSCKHTTAWWLCRTQAWAPHAYQTANGIAQVEESALASCRHRAGGCLAGAASSTCVPWRFC